MMFGLSLPLRDYVYLAAILIIALGLAWCHHTAVLKGEARVRAADDRAVALAQKAVEAQKLVDARTAQEATHGLETELATLRRNAAQPPPMVRLCVSSARRPLPAPPEPPGGASSPAPAARELPSVPQGVGAGPDLGPELQRFAFTCDTLSAEHRALLEWVRGVTK